MSDYRQQSGTEADEDKKPLSPVAGKDIAPEIQACNELGTMLGEELAEVEEEIERVAGIISEAVGKLSSSFDQMHQLAGGMPRADHGDSPDTDLEQAVSEAVQALQFEDIAAQALAEAMRSISYLRDVAEEVRTVDDAGELAARISRYHRTWAKMRRRAVLQKNLDTGSVDLF